MKYQEAKEEIKERISIVDVVNRYVPLKKSGSNYMGVCPFHPDKNPSMSVSESRKRFKCFACDKGGDVFAFLSEYLGITYFEAVNMLAKEANIEIDADYSDINFKKQQDEKKQKVFNVNKDAANYYFRSLFSDDGKDALKYLMLKRKLTKETIKKFGLGYSPKNTRDLYNKLKEKGHDDDAILASTLFNLNEQNEINGYFFDRIMFPVLDVYRNILGFQSRSLDPDAKYRKYVNSKENIAFKKESILFGYNFAFHSKFDYYIVCEGNMDVITLNQAGYDNAVASQGIAFTDRQIDLFKRRPKSKRIYLCQDTDSAGITAKNKSADELSRFGFETYAIDLYPSKDVDEFLNDKNYGPDEFAKRLAKPIPSILYYVSTAKYGLDLNNPYDLEKYLKLIAVKLASIDNKILREKYVKDAAIQEHIDSSELNALVNDVLKGNSIKTKVINNNFKSSENEKTTENSINDNAAERTFIRLAYENQDFHDQITKSVAIDEITNKVCSFLYKKYLDNVKFDEIYDCLDELSIEEKKYAEMILDPDKTFDNSNIEDTKIALNSIIRTLKINNIKTKRTDASIDDIFRDNQTMLDIKETVFIK